jgi:hypothetical protein
MYFCIALFPGDFIVWQQINTEGIVMNMNSNFSSLNKKPLFQQMPKDFNGAEAWRDWALKLREWAYTASQDDKKRRKQLKKLRKELSEKNDVFECYKKRIEELENTILAYESNLIIRGCILIRNIFNKISSK